MIFPDSKMKRKLPQTKTQKNSNSANSTLFTVLFRLICSNHATGKHP